MCKAFWASQEDLWSWDFVPDSTTCTAGPSLPPCVTCSTSLSQMAPFSSLPGCQHRETMWMKALKKYEVLYNFQVISLFENTLPMVKGFGLWRQQLPC